MSFLENVFETKDIFQDYITDLQQQDTNRILHIIIANAKAFSNYIEQKSQQIMTETAKWFRSSSHQQPGASQMRSAPAANRTRHVGSVTCARYGYATSLRNPTTGRCNVFRGGVRNLLWIPKINNRISWIKRSCGEELLFFFLGTYLVYFGTLQFFYGISIKKNCGKYKTGVSFMC